MTRSRARRDRLPVRPPSERVSGPTGKVEYATGTEADHAIDAIARRSNRALVPQRAYPCTHCGCWHVTSQADVPEFATDIVLLEP